VRIREQRKKQVEEMDKDTFRDILEAERRFCSKEAD